MMRGLTTGIENKVLPLLAINGASNYLPPIYNPSTIPPGAFSIQVQNIPKQAETEQKEESNILKLYPNPTQEVVNIDYSLPNNIAQAELIILSLDGKKVWQRAVNQPQGTEQVNISAQRNGQYIALLKCQGKTLAEFRFVIAR